MVSLSDYEHRYQHVRFDRSDGILEVTLHTDGGSLVWSPQVHRELPEAFSDIANDPDTKVVILTGSGSAFCDSGDSEAFAREQPRWDSIWWEGKRLLTNLVDIDVPVVGVVNGPATIHAEIALLSDVVLASDTAEFADAAHFPNGIVPGDGVHIVWDHLLGTNRSRYFLLTGELIGAVRAQELGVVNEVLPAADLLPRARALAAQIAVQPLPVLRYTRAALVMGLRRLVRDGLSHGLALEGCGAAASPPF
jgi:enoyl-CoA hydratase/carnithine racemase